MLTKAIMFYQWHILITLSLLCSSYQIRFDIFKECLPLRESAFKVSIRDNYLGFKFKQELSSTQVEFPVIVSCTLVIVRLVS